MEEVEAPPKSVHDKITDYKNMVVDAYKNKPVSYWLLLLLGSSGMLIAFPASSLLS
ncbi:putative purine permease, plant [Helianthus annuus]|nr:putative purine permease, plant [Helianthus annuus]KAJ0447187.1 hypothetical protein HanHA89_Chr17g0702541 [Helianthus annuus]KAJ0632096.1 hypothetical protein HanLR1_Chr17g0661231 [Helianthus annuus]KAJ0825918.1 putative purine permease, plant [Helianthus annuus]